MGKPGLFVVTRNNEGDGGGSGSRHELKSIQWHGTRGTVNKWSAVKSGIPEPGVDVAQPHLLEVCPRKVYKDFTGAPAFRLSPEISPFHSAVHGD